MDSRVAGDRKTPPNGIVRRPAGPLVDPALTSLLDRYRGLLPDAELAAALHGCLRDLDCSPDAMPELAYRLLHHRLDALAGRGLVDAGDGTGMS